MHHLARRAENPAMPPSRWIATDFNQVRPRDHATGTREAFEHEAARFDREMKLIGRLNHTHIVNLIDSGQLEDHRPYMVLEFVEGEPLSALLDREGALPTRDAIRLMSQVLDALGYAHEQGVIHRDLKPGNVFLCHVAGEDDHVKVMDFGIARVIEADENQGHLTKTGMTQGTPAYMAPEQAMALKATPASDLYSMACMFYEMLTGEMVFTGDSSVAISLAHVNDAPPTLRIPGASTELSRRWDKLFQELVHKKPQSRIPSASEVVERLEALAKLPDPGLEGAAGPVDALDQTEAATPAVVEVPEQDDLVTEFVAGAVVPEDEIRTELELPEISRGGSRLRALAAVIVVGLALLGLASLWGSEDEGAAQADVEPPASSAPPGGGRGCGRGGTAGRRRPLCRCRAAGGARILRDRHRGHSWMSPGRTPPW